MPKTLIVTPSERPRWSASEAAKRCGVGRATILRAITDGRITGADQDEQGWRIPLESLLAAGFTVDRPAPDRGQAQGVPDDRDRTIQDLRAELALEQVRRAAAVTLADALTAHLRTALRAIEGPAPLTDPDESPISASAPVGNLVANAPGLVAKRARWSWHRQP